MQEREEREEREERDRDSTGTLNRQHECVKASTSGTVGITESLTGLFSFSHTWLSSMTLSCGGNRAASSSSCDGPCKGGPAWKFDEEVGECESCGYARGLCASCGHALLVIPNSVRRFEFSLIVRRHHCRSCGRIFCHTCSQRRQFVVNLGQPPSPSDSRCPSSVPALNWTRSRHKRWSHGSPCIPIDRHRHSKQAVQMWQ